MRAALVAVLAVSMMTSPAAAQDKPPPAPVPAAGQQRTESLQPKPSETPEPGRARFEAEPVRDGAIVAIAVGFAGLLELIESTGEIHPSQIPQNFDVNNLLSIDRGAVRKQFDEHAALLSNLGLLTAMAYAMVDPIATGVRHSNVQSGLVDGIIFVESLSITWAVTNLAKIAVRRPRPRAYQLAQEHKDDPNYMSFETDTALSFFSGHAALTAAVSATATYLAFVRSPGSARPWITLAAGTALSVFVSYERVRSGAHFPTDVIAGMMAGAGIGVLIPHFHRAESAKQRPLWIGYAPQIDGGSLVLGGQF